MNLTNEFHISEVFADVSKMKHFSSYTLPSVKLHKLSTALLPVRYEVHVVRGWTGGA